VEDNRKLILEDASSIREAMERMVRYVSDAAESLGRQDRGRGPGRLSRGRGTT
jgi:hypothetical protein